MSKENFLLVSLKEDESKKLAQVISNKTSRKILDLLAEKSMTETDISKKLKVPLSTIHYNMQALQKARLVTADEYHYSEKGKEVNHYSLANKYVIIAPQDAPSNLRERLRRILPTAIVGIAGAGLVHLFTRAPAVQFMNMKSMADEAMESEALLGRAAAPMEDSVAEPVAHAVASEPNLALWFLFGVIATIIIFIIVDYIQNRK